MDSLCSWEAVMGGQREATRNLVEILADVVKMMDSTFKNVESQLQQVESSLAALDERGRELEKRISSQVIDLHNKIKDELSRRVDPNTPIPLEEGCVVDLEEWERKLEGKFFLMEARDRELRDGQKRISEEVASLATGIREKGLLVAAKEVEIKSFKQAIGTRIEALEILVKRQSEVRKRRSRVFSFLVDAGKKSQS